AYLTRETSRSVLRTDRPFAWVDAPCIGVRQDPPRIGVEAPRRVPSEGLLRLRDLGLCVATRLVALDDHDLGILRQVARPPVMVVGPAPLPREARRPADVAVLVLAVHVGHVGHVRAGGPVAGVNDVGHHASSPSWPLPSSSIASP